MTTPSSSRLTVSPEAVAGAAGLLATAVIAASVAMRTLSRVTGRPSIYGLVAFFDLDTENNLPTFLATLLLLGAAVTAGLIAVLHRTARDPDGRRWQALAALLFLLAADEAAGFHEKLMRPTRELLGPQWASGPLHFAWVVPGTLAVLLVAVGFFRFWRRLARRTRMLTALAAALYVGGALGLEMLGGVYAEQPCRQDLYTVVSTLEESCELFGVVVGLYAMLDYLRATFGQARLRLDFGRRG